jgi:hypothetical protein
MAAEATWADRRQARDFLTGNSAGEGSIGYHHVFCPESGRNLVAIALGTQDVTVDSELITRIAASTGLSAGEASRVVADVIGWYHEPVEAYVRRRHAGLQMYGKRNDEIFALIAAELAERLVAAPCLSERQLRRIVYG